MKGITASEEFSKNPELKNDDVVYIQEWASKQEHFPKNIPDEVIILILHSCYFSLELTKQTLDNYFTMRTHIPEFFNDRDVELESVSEAIKTSYMVPLKGTTKEGFRVIFCGLKRLEPSLYHFAETMKVFNMVVDAWYHRDGTAPGIVIVLNMEGMSFGHIARLNLPTMKKILVYLQEGMPVRLKGFHYINVVPFIDAVMALMKPFMKKELIDMLQFHTDGMDSLYEHIPKDVLPNIVGGKAGEIDELQKQTVDLMSSHTDWFKADEAMRVDESKRIGSRKNVNELFGVEGSFRKLNID